jgi:hypothetical protein
VRIKQTRVADVMVVKCQTVNTRSGKGVTGRRWSVIISIYVYMPANDCVYGIKQCSIS